MKLLIVRLSALGDLVHALPLAANAHRAGAAVAWLVDSRYAGLLEGNPAIERVFCAATRAWRRNPTRPEHWRALSELRTQIRNFAPDVVVDAQGLWKSAVLAKLAGAPVVGLGRGSRREPSSAPLLDRAVEVPRGVAHVVDQTLLLLSSLDIPIVDAAPDARYLLESTRPEAEAFAAALPRPFAVYHPGAARARKTWGERRFAELAKTLDEEHGVFPVVSWGPGDEGRAEALTSAIPRARAIPSVDVSGLAHAIAGAALFVGGDTGPAHLADALGVPSLVLFGPRSGTLNVPERNRPYRGFALRYDESTAVAEVVARAAEILRGTAGARS